MTARRIAAAFLAMLGAVGVTASAYLNWYADTPPELTPLDRLFETGITEEATSYWTSVALPLALVTVVTLVGVLLQSRLVVLVAWLIGLATLVLFVVMQAREDADFSFGDLQTGVWVAVAGLIIMLIGLVNIEPPAPVLESDEPLTVMQSDRYAPAPPPPPADTAVLDTHRWSGPAEPYPPDRYGRSELDDETRPVGLPYGAPERHHEPQPETQVISAPEPHHAAEPDTEAYAAPEPQHEPQPEDQSHRSPEPHHEPEHETQLFGAPEPHHEAATNTEGGITDDTRAVDAEKAGYDPSAADAPPGTADDPSAADAPPGTADAPPHTGDAPPHTGDAPPDTADAEDDRPPNA